MNIDKQTINEQVYGHKHLDSRQRTLYCAVECCDVSGLQYGSEKMF